MEMELARTFLEVVAAGNFVNAAARLNVTQSTVSARIRLLEERLGRTLFVRNKAGASLTPAGSHFQRHAAALVRVWEQARQEVAVPPGFRSVLAIGGQAGLWNRMLHKWLPWMRSRAPDIALRAELGLPEGLIYRLVEGTLDIGVMFTPQSRPGLTVEMLLEEQLVLVTTDAEARDPLGEGYVHVDWGEEFHAKHRLEYPEFLRAGLSVGLGTLGFGFILENGGSGYFPSRFVRPHVESGRLRLVPGAPVFSHPIYAAYPGRGGAAGLETALAGLRLMAARESEEQPE